MERAAGTKPEMGDPHDLRDLTARLGAPHLEQRMHRSGELPRMAFYWGCGCTAMGPGSTGTPAASMRWTRCGHHAAIEAEEALA
jgi:hypothetical protein